MIFCKNPIEVKHSLLFIAQLGLHGMKIKLNDRHFIHFRKFLKVLDSQPIDSMFFFLTSRSLVGLRYVNINNYYKYNHIHTSNTYSSTKYRL